jgi:hypothetical protein
MFFFWKSTLLDLPSGKRFFYKLLIISYLYKKLKPAIAKLFGFIQSLLAS